MVTRDLILNQREINDLELLLNGSLYPLKTYVNQKDYLNILNNHRLSTGELFPLPITLSVTEAYDVGAILYLCDETNYRIAELTISEIYLPDEDEDLKCFGTKDSNHPYIQILNERKNKWYVSGSLNQIHPILHYDFLKYRLTPNQTKEIIGSSYVIGFQTRNPLHRSHIELMKKTIKKAQDKTGHPVKVLLQPVVGITQPCDVNYHTRVKCYLKILKYLGDQVIFSLLPLAMRMGGPREAMLHAIIRRNYGCKGFIIGRDHAGPSYKSKEGKSFYGEYDAQNFVLPYEKELGIDIYSSPNIVYVKEIDGYLDEEEVKEVSLKRNLTVLSISGTQQRDMIRKGIDPPSWFTYPEVFEQLAKDERKVGTCYYFIGLSGSGKSTLANALSSYLKEFDDRKVTLLDADVVRRHLSKGLGFSKEDRSTNVRRIGFLASEIVKHGGICIVANIAPYEEDRLFNRSMISNEGRYIEIYVSTPLEICIERDVKGIYKKAQQGLIKNVTGVDDPFEEPGKSDLRIESTKEINCIIEEILKV